MKNDFFKYLLLNGGSQADKEWLVSGTLPFVFKSNGHRLRNYRIYGAEGGVGDFDSETGKYIIPITMYGQTENLVSEIITGKYYNGANEVTNANMATSDFIEIEPNTKYTSAHFDNNGNYASALVFCTWDSQKNFIMQVSNAETITTESNAKYITVRNFASNPTGIKGTNFCLVRGDVRPAYASQTYFLPKTYSISLDEPIGVLEYIDFREQKSSDGDIVLMPALPTENGENIVDVTTTLQPANICLQGNIEKILSVSLQTLKFNRDLQTMELGNDLQLDVMPIDRSEIQTGYVFEKPVKNRDESEQEENVIETTRDDENAE